MSSYRKIILRSIKGSFARFMAILAIIALGVGFYSGLTLTEPCLSATGDKYSKDYNMFDFRLISTIGFDDEDITKLSNLDGVRACSGAYVQDVIAELGDSDPHVIRIHSLMDDINMISVEAGRLPQSSDEIIVDAYRLGPEVIGSTIRISDTNDKSDSDNLRYQEYTIVGVGRSPNYLNFQRGSTNVGNGTIYFYAYIPECGFDMEYYAEAYLTYDVDFFMMSDEYEDYMDERQPILEEQVQEIIDNRFDEILEENYDDLYDAYNTFESERADAWAELSDGYQELLDARDEIEDARIELEDAWNTLVEAEQELNDAQNQIDTNTAEVDSREAELNTNYQNVISGLSQANDTKTSLENQLQTVNDTIDELEGQIATIDELLPQVQNMEEMGMELPEGTPSSAELLENRALLESGMTEALQGKAAIEAGLVTVNSTIDELNGYLDDINSGYDAIRDARAQIASAQTEVNTGRTEYNNGVDEYEDAFVEFQDGINEYEDGRREYYSGLSEFQEKISAAAREIEYGLRVLSGVERPSTYVLGRDMNVGYVSFRNDSQIVSGIAKVFPVFFFGLAALVCSTTMQRMVSDERSEIGTMRALGYSEISIINKYIIYSGTASVIGCIGGFLGGIRLFPYIIWSVYEMMYGFAPIVFVNSYSLFLIVLLISLVCSVGVTVVTAVNELKGMPAELIRPKAPVAGKRILLERIGFLWKPLKFTYKVSIRNVFRFKKRMFMMIVGIAGSTALLFAAFGIRDSINDIVNIEYDTIFPYNLSVVFEDGQSEEDIHKSVADTNRHFGIDTECVLTRTVALTHQGEDTIRDVNLIVSDDPNITNACRSYIDGERCDWPADGEIAISSKLALVNGIEPGDEITFGYGDDGETFTLRVGYIFDNYTFHYAYMNGNTYSEAMHEVYEPNTALVIRDSSNSEESTGIDDNDYGSYIASHSQVKSWSAVKASRESFGETIKKLNNIVVLVIGCAGALAFIVLFNLNNINITERIREIATIKVLGFHKMEAGTYMFRENVILVVMGFIVGIPTGIILHRFIMEQIDMDMITYMVQIYPKSYMYVLFFIILFSVIVDVVMRIKINKIDMAESLKSIE